MKTFRGWLWLVALAGIALCSGCDKKPGAAAPPPAEAQATPSDPGSAAPVEDDGNAGATTLLPNVGAAPLPTSKCSAVPAPCFPVHNLTANLTIGSDVQSAVRRSDSAGLVFTVPMNLVEPTQGAFTFATGGATNVFTWLSANLRPEQVIIPGVLGGNKMPPWVGTLGANNVALSWALPASPSCIAYNFPLWTDHRVVLAYAAAVHGMLAYLDTLTVASDHKSLRSHIAGINLAFWAMTTAELRIPASGCGSQTAEQQAAIWTAAGYTPAGAAQAYHDMLADIVGDPTLPAEAFLMQNEMGDAFPRVATSINTYAAIVSDAADTIGGQFVLSWDMMSDAGPTIDAPTLAQAADGTPLALQTNETAPGSVTSGQGWQIGVGKTLTPATPAQFADMFVRNAATVPEESNDGRPVLFQIGIADYAQPGYFPAP